MHLGCEHCGKTFDLLREKVPQGQKFRFFCPNCGEKNVVDKQQEHLNIDSNPETFQEPGEGPELSIEPDKYPPGSQVAFVRVSDSVWQDRIQAYLEANGYYIEMSGDSAQAAKKLSLNSYSFVLIQDLPENKPLLQEIANWPGNTRREINCVLIGEKAKSFDPKQAFLRGVNSYLNIEKKDGIEDLLEKSREYFNSFIEPWRVARDRKQ